MEAISTNSSARENLRLALSIFPSSCVQTATTLVQPFQQINKSYNKSTATECIFLINYRQINNIIVYVRNQSFRFNLYCVSLIKSL